MSYNNETTQAVGDALTILQPLMGWPQEMSFSDACKVLFHGKSKWWVKHYIMSRYPEIWSGDNSWMTPSQGTGKPIKVTNVPRAAVWLAEHQDEIDWLADDPRTLDKKLFNK